MSEKIDSNPFFKEWTTPYGTIPFDEIKTGHFLPALTTGLEKARAEIKRIREDKNSPNFDNTIRAVEAASEPVDLVVEVYWNLMSAEADEAMHALADTISPMLADYSNDILLDAVLFARVKTIFDEMTAGKVSNLSVEQRKMIEKSYKGFVRNGALLDDVKKEKLRALDQEQSKLGPQFSQNVLKATYAFELEIKDQAQLKGLPEGAVEAAANLAQQKGKAGSWLFNLEAPSFVPFITYADDRSLREKMFRAQSGRCVGGDFDNREILKRLAVLRYERALLLGFQSHADYVLEERMAESPTKVKLFMERLLKIAKPAAEKDLAELIALKNKETGDDDFMPWDIRYYSQKLKQQRFDFREEALRPYFKLENVIGGIFEHAKRLYNLSFKPLDGISVYHPDVRVYEVTDEVSKKMIGIFYADFFPRPTKKGGAWMTPLREQGMFGGVNRRPHIGIVCNFTQPTKTKPSLLTLDEVRTLFHEFGHALHGLLSDCTYRSLAGTNVYWDFVELPSQIMENWISEKEALDLFATHFETGEKIPVELTKKIKDSAAFQSGYSHLQQISLATLDMAWHVGNPSAVKDVEAFEKEALANTRILPTIDGSNVSCSFGHIFAGGYSAGYYSYKWAEVLEADAFELFLEKGIFSKDVAKAFREKILSKGGTAHPMELYKSFRGREPDPDALLRRDRLI